MRAKAKAVAALVGAVLGAWAWTVPAQAADSRQDTCYFLANIDPNKLYDTLATYGGKVMGKYPEHWADIDYTNLMANVRVCDGQPAYLANKVSAVNWQRLMSDIQRRNTQINGTSLAIAAAYGKYWTSGDEFPACAQFLKWKRDDLWFDNNSEDLFGTAFMEMSPDVLALYGRLVQECKPVMEGILDRRRVSLKNADLLIKSVLESIDKDSQARQESPDELPDDLKVMHSGKLLPLAYLRKTTQDVVRRIAALELHDRVLPTNALIQISKWSKQIEGELSDGPDLLYAKKVQDVIAAHMFKSAEEMPDNGAASAAPVVPGFSSGQ